MAAYAALVSLSHIIDQIQNHPRPPISLDKSQVESLIEKVASLQEFLEGYSHVGYSKEPDALEMRIADAAYAAEDVIESHIVDQILSGSKSHEKKIRYFNCSQGRQKATGHGEKVSSTDMYQGLWKVIEEMDSIKKEVMEIKEKMGVQDQLHRNSVSAGSLRSSTGQNTMVGFDDVLVKVIDELTGGKLDRQIIPIVGMGGIGKTTLARNIYQNQVIVQYFDILVWVTISQEYKMREILLELLQEDAKKFSQLGEYELGDILHKRLSGWRYLIILDDIWDIEVWGQLKLFFPNNNNGSRIMFTTRLSNLASQVAATPAVHVAFLDEHNSWNLFSEIVFGKEGCPFELEKIGKKIVKNCKGLPLSIVVIGGLLAKSKLAREYWEYVLENLNSVLNLDNNESCLKILHMSYSQLPVYLKPCFLYMGVFKEDRVIRVSILIKLWVEEGFLKPISGKSLEVIAKENLHELINRNLILVHKMGSTGSVKYCKVHDLVRDLCLREVQKEKFYDVTRRLSFYVPQRIKVERRIVILENTSEENVFDALQSMSFSRSLICYNDEVLPLVNFRLLRILKTCDKDSVYSLSSKDKNFLENMFQLVNLRYLAVDSHFISKFSSSISLLWNLHTVIVKSRAVFITAPAEIWNMSQLRHVEFKPRVCLPDPTNGYVGKLDNIILANLQTLMKVRNFKCGKEMIKRIPNIKKLSIDYTEVEGRSHYYLNNLDCLHKLESFHCSSHLMMPMPSGTGFLHDLTLPPSLKKLTLLTNHVHWEDMLEKIGSLPVLEKLQLRLGSFRGRKWQTVEGQFSSLKFLLISWCRNLDYWTTESSHFPRLEHLVLKNLFDLKEIPLEIGEIPTLQSIELEYCSHSAIISAKKILEEQEELHGEVALQVRVILSHRQKNEALESLASPNFQLG